MANTRKAIGTALENELSGKDTIEVTLFDQTFRLKKRFKRLKFLRLLTTDPMKSLELVFADGELDRLEEMDMSEDELSSIFDAVSEALVGGQKN